MSKGNQDWWLRYIPEGLRHLKPSMYMSQREMESEFTIGGMKPSSFIYRCKRTGRPCTEYRDGTRKRYRLGELAAKARALSMPIHTIQKPSKDGRRVKHPQQEVICAEASKAMISKRMLTESQIVAKAAKINVIGVCGVYFLVRRGKVEYVGQSINVNARIATHIQSGKTFDEWCYIPCSPQNLNLIESLYIHALKPPGNGYFKGTSHPVAPMSIAEIYSLLVPHRETGTSEAQGA